ncbi:NHL repeat-containing protein [Candidatus Magnetominusculus dajiuhuensis]|uniref:NHL repeat-containing protein n=1 Tax=Candidatus Magnetominusculus dajiuhuensis TaxID=3137712 RepID=UPI003B4313CD
MKKITAIVAMVVLAFCLSAYAAEQTGVVINGQTPVASSSVTLYRAGAQRGMPAVVLGTAQSDTKGNFTISYTPPTDTNAVLYMIADGGINIMESPVRLATVLGTAPVSASVSANVVINERTTVATAYAMAKFISGGNISGTSPGLQNAAAVVQNLVDITTGNAGTVLSSSPNGTATSAMSQFNTLANLLASCVGMPRVCPPLFALATPPGGSAPQDTLQAIVNIAHYPWQNVWPLYALSNVGPYSPALSSAPDAWTLAIKYIGNGSEFDGPGNMAIDKDGNVWVTNNYEFNSDPLQPVCGGKLVMKLTPTGSDALGAPFSGGGIDGTGFGIGIDTNGDVWLSNFGFQGKGCTTPPASNSVSKFSAAGVALSPNNGFTSGGIGSPQGTASDQSGNIWIANYDNNSITQYPLGNPNAPLMFKNVGLDKPFGLAIDGKGNAWIASSGNDSVVAIDPNGSPLTGSPFTGGGIKTPLGIAVDSLGNVWTANSLGGSVTLIRSDSRLPQQLVGGGLTTPWGIAVDGDDNIWVANFEGQRLTQLCGAKHWRCPTGYRTGDPISQGTGYTSDALVRNTGVAIDPSGNVWVANNWKSIPVQTNPGGDGLVVFIGLAPPIKTPLIGPPQPPEPNYTAAVDAIARYTYVFSAFFGAKLGDISAGSSASGTYYVQWFTNGTGILAWPDGNVYVTYNGGWLYAGIGWK